MANNLLQKFRTRRATLAAESEALRTTAEAENRGLTDDEKQRDDVIYAEITTLDADIEREERHREWARTAPPVASYSGDGRLLEPATNVTNVVPVETAPPVPGGHRPWIHDARDLALEKPWGFDTYRCTASQFVARYSTTAFPADHPFHPAHRYQNAADGEFLQALFRASKGYGTDPRLIYQSAAQGAGELVGADGGFLVPRPSTDRLLLRMTAGQVLSRVDRSPLTQGNSLDINVIDESSRATGSRHGAVQGYRLDEGGTITASRPKFKRLEFKLHKYAAFGYATDELLADASLVGRMIFQAFGDELRFMVEDDIINGTGSGMPQGILTSAALVSVAKESGQAATTFTWENAVKMVARFYAPLFSRAVWFINQDVYPQLFSMTLSVGTGGAPVYLPANGAAGAPHGTLFGLPVVPIEYGATLGTVGDVILVALSEYWFFDKGSPEEASSMHVAFTTDEQAFRVTYRADGRSSWVSTLAPYKGGTNTQSHIVALNTRA